MVCAYVRCSRHCPMVTPMFDGHAYVRWSTPNPMVTPMSDGHAYVRWSRLCPMFLCFVGRQSPLVRWSRVRLMVFEKLNVSLVTLCRLQNICLVYLLLLNYLINKDSENSYRSKANRADFFLINIEHFFEQFHGINNICAL